MSARPVHLALPCPDPSHHACAGPVACREPGTCRPGKWKRTADPLQVTCAGCLASPAFEEPL